MRSREPGLLDWLRHPSPEHGVSFLDDNGNWAWTAYHRLAHAALARGGELLQCTGPGQRVLITHPTGPDFVTAFFGTLAAGCTPVPLSPPQALGGTARWVSHAAHVIQTVRPALILTAEPYRQLLEAASQEAGHHSGILTAPPTAPAAGGPQDVAETALIQFTSGSRAAARGVPVSAANLETNIHMIHRMLGHFDTVGTSWLPLYHDMGLVGGFLLPVVLQMPHQMMRPGQFISAPIRWLAQYGRGTGQVMAMPNFGMDYVVKRIRPADLEGMDLTGVRTVITAAERVRPSSVASFYRLLAPIGLRWETLRPMYGLAEATLAVTGAQARRVPRMVGVKRTGERFGQAVEVGDVREASELAHLPNGTDEPLVWHLSCGQPSPGTAVRIVDEHLAALPDGHVGEIAVAGPCVVHGYLDQRTTGTTRITKDTLLTGDAGFVMDGDLFVLGRMGDCIQVRGRNVFVEEVEDSLFTAFPSSARRSVVVAGYRDGNPQVTVLTTQSVGVDVATAMLDTLIRHVGSDVDLAVDVVPRDLLQFTSSGKPRRASIWRARTEGDVTVTTLAVHHATGVETAETGLPGRHIALTGSQR
ncbi:AMP-binding protein [Micromonospora sp. BRA006-A]|uniref:AMP-binding protein n=1 Tax=Micromonospora sp. BRA006-A TaxID=2962860 RepID=UPI00296E9AF8|nr:AMP-binding protein [Micromonospora sp. BRA006-A]MDW3845664.1 AMP-binding protein [Micromonospora sp. BRA006-A]